jgi:hypothetical protein
MILHVELTVAQARVLLEILSEGADGIAVNMNRREWEPGQRAIDKIEPRLREIASADRVSRVAQDHRD